MTCRHCGADIADKALICYKCGAATSDPVRRAPAPRRAPRGTTLPLLGLLVLVLAALFLGQTQTGEVSPAVSYTIAALAAVVLAWRIWQRRSR
jgi:hypothetical protein